MAGAGVGGYDGECGDFVDYDNDGFMDVGMGGKGRTEALYRNVGGTFVDVTSSSGSRHGRMRSVLPGAITTAMAFSISTSRAENRAAWANSQARSTTTAATALSPR